METIDDKTIIKPYKEQDLKIYAYNLPDLPTHEGAVKVGETSRDVEKRLKEQLSTAGLKPNILFTRQAKKINGEWFHDKELHRYFILNNIKNKDLGTGASEWFYFNGNPNKAEELTDKFISMDYLEVQMDSNNYDYKLREEQEKAIKTTIEYFTLNLNREKDFLWNAKPRFGKTLTTYDLILKLNCTNTIIVTNRPAIANSWFDDFKKFISWKRPKLKFVSDSDALKGKAISHNEYIDFISKLEDVEGAGRVYFISLQDIKGARIFGGNYDKLSWIASLDWDLLVIDEAHEGIDTRKTNKAFLKIKRRYTLHLSGTPFKAISNNKFDENQIYNWSYTDEQFAKKNWDESKGTNPYENLPQLSLFTFQMSKMIEDKVKQGICIEGKENMDYAFDLNEFFSVEGEKFKYEDSVKKFLDNLSKGKLPFSKDEYRHKLNHTFWLLPRVASAKAMERLLKKHEVFKDYYVVLAAGDGKSIVDDIESFEEDINKTEKSFDKVREAISKYDRTITLSVGQLTTGVTVPQWTAVFMLSNIKSPSLYFQAAFRSQNPYEFKDEETGNLLRKEKAYIFDFAPERTLTLFDEFANNLSLKTNKNTTDGRKENIKELLNFFPVIAEDEKGTMYELDASDVITIPNLIKSKEVVKRGFMSNLLFANISSIFRAPEELKKILDKISPEKNKRLTEKVEINITNPMIDDDGNIDIPKEIVINKTKDIFGESIYKIVEEKSKDINILKEISVSEEVEAKEITNILKNAISDNIDNFRIEFGLNKKNSEKLDNNISKKMQDTLLYEIKNRNNEINLINDKYKQDLEKADTIEDKEIIIETIKKETDKINNEFTKNISEKTISIYENIVEEQIEKQEETKKKIAEDEVKDHLRGFARTIPAFLMAYGNEETTLASFDKGIDENTFKELTSITIDEFKKLRDGIEYIDENGEQKYISGLFDEVVFNASIKEFFEVKKRLGNYLDNEFNEDIFDYIPPQKTNQIFTPRALVKMMVDMLEKNDENIFKNKNIKFLDLYTKSGLYLAEIAKRLYINLENVITDKNKRIKHILENQIYGFAPTDIIYNMVKNFMYSDFENIETKNLIKYDMQMVAEEEMMKEKIEEVWGEKMKFDVIIGNPPYQESDGGAQASAKPIYHYFMRESKRLNPEFISFITPSRWFTGGKGLDEYRDEMINDIHLQEIHDWLTPDDIFPNTNIRGGVNYYLWNKYYNNLKNNIRFVSYKNKKIISDKKRPLKIYEIEILIRDNTAIQILEKIDCKNSLSSEISTRKPFGIESNFINDIEYKSDKNDMKKPVICYGKGKRLGFIEFNLIKNNQQWIDKWKVFTPRANNIGTELNDDNLNSFIGKPGTICTESYMSIGGDLDLDEISANNIIKYLKTKFVRFLHGLAKASQDATSKTYKFVPLQDFTNLSDIDWSKSIFEIDKQLYDKYNLNDEERHHIDKSIKEMS